MDPTVVEVRLDRGRFLFLLNNVATWGEVSFAVATLLEYIYPFPRRHKPDSVHGPLIDPLIFEKTNGNRCSTAQPSPYIGREAL